MAPSFLLKVYAILTSVVLLCIPPSDGSNDYANYIKCSATYSCGKIQHIGYPFWGGNRPQFCGRQEFQLSCDDNETSLKDSSHSRGPPTGPPFMVLSISTPTNTICLGPPPPPSPPPPPPPFQRRGLGSAGPPCPPSDKHKQPAPWHHEWPAFFNFSPNVQNISIFYGCSSSNVLKFKFQSLACWNQTKNETENGYYFGEQVSDTETLSKSCITNVTIPVLRSELYKIKENKTSEHVGAKIEMIYMPKSSACSKCLDSGCACGSPNQSFVCYCKDRPRPLLYHNSGKIKLGLTRGIAAGGGILGLIAVALLLAICYRKKLSQYRSTNDSPENLDLEIESGSKYFGIPLFSYTELKDATANFDDTRELGKGGFGTVYYGKLKDGKEVAVKRLYEKSQKRVEQFMNEVRILTGLRHYNLVSLYGCTSCHSKELLLVYEYVPNGTLADHLHGAKAAQQSLSWPIRLRIAIETATALSFLHSSDIIHRDVKTNNILQDSDFNAKVADFGLSRLFPNNVTHVSTAPQGTPGYLDPEYHQCYKLTDKSDVYSFGVVLAELISSLPAVDMNRYNNEINLSNYAMTRIRQCAFDDFVDPKLGFASDVKVRRMITLVTELAFRCLQHVKDYRPSMEEVLDSLKRIESADYESPLTDDMVKNNVVMEIMNPLSSPTEDDGAKLLNLTLRPHSPASVIGKWCSRSTFENTSSGE